MGRNREKDKQSNYDGKVQKDKNNQSKIYNKFTKTQ